MTRPAKRTLPPVHPIRIGCAGWPLPAGQRGGFPPGASVLERYAARLDGVEINSSLHRPHRRETYRRWADSVPPGFRFSVKLPRSISHEHRLKRSGALLDAFLDGCMGLGDMLGCLLVQLPPSLAFEARTAATFFAMLRRRWDGPVACEPRHAGWFEDAADALLVRHRIARVAADPAPHPGADTPGGDRSLAYWRWHGSPRMYYSAYGEARLAPLADRLRAAGTGAAGSWMVFDNTAHGHAIADALCLQSLLQGR